MFEKIKMFGKRFQTKKNKKTKHSNFNSKGNLLNSQGEPIYGSLGNSQRKTPEQNLLNSQGEPIYGSLGNSQRTTHKRSLLSKIFRRKQYKITNRKLRRSPPRSPSSRSPSRSPSSRSTPSRSSPSRSSPARLSPARLSPSRSARSSPPSQLPLPKYYENYSSLFNDEDLINKIKKADNIFVFDFDFTLSSIHSKGNPNPKINYLDEEQLQIVNELFNDIKKNQTNPLIIILSRSVQSQLRENFNKLELFKEFVNENCILGGEKDTHYLEAININNSKITVDERWATKKKNAIMRIAEIQNQNKINIGNIYFYDDTDLNINELKKIPKNEIYVGIKGVNVPTYKSNPPGYRQIFKIYLKSIYKEEIEP